MLLAAPATKKKTKKKDKKETKKKDKKKDKKAKKKRKHSSSEDSPPATVKTKRHQTLAITTPDPPDLRAFMEKQFATIQAQLSGFNDRLTATEAQVREKIRAAMSTSPITHAQFPSLGKPESPDQRKARLQQETNAKLLQAAATEAQVLTQITIGKYRDL